MKTKLLLGALIFSQLMGCGEEGIEPPVATPVASQAKFLTTENAIAERYIVLLNDAGKPSLDAQAESARLVRKYGGEVIVVYKHAIKGFAARMTDEQARLLSADEAVSNVQEDGKSEINSVQSSPSWGLDRIDQANLPLNNSYTYDPNGGAGVHVYVVDTGVRTTHSQFRGRIGLGANFVADGNDTVEDCHGHGTHVAGTVAGTTYGVAKKAIIHPIRAQDCAGAGPDSMVLQAVDWIYANHTKPAVVNMSLKTKSYAALELAINHSIVLGGITYVIAAGNDGVDACGVTPARVPAAITVGASHTTDVMPGFANYGTCIDIFAPGTQILSSGNASDTASFLSSGTSMAAPHVAGAAALYLARNPTHTPAQVTKFLVDGSTKDKVTGNTRGAPNRLLYITPPEVTCTMKDVAPRAGNVGTTFWATWDGKGADDCTWELNGAPQGKTGCNNIKAISGLAIGSYIVNLTASNYYYTKSCKAAFTVAPTCSVTISPTTGTMAANTKFLLTWKSDASACTYKKDSTDMGPLSPCTSSGYVNADFFGTGSHSVTLSGTKSSVTSSCTSNKVTIN